MWLYADVSELFCRPMGLDPSKPMKLFHNFFAPARVGPFLIVPYELFLRTLRSGRCDTRTKIRLFSTHFMLIASNPHLRKNRMWNVYIMKLRSSSSSRKSWNYIGLRQCDFERYGRVQLSPRFSRTPVKPRMPSRAGVSTCVTRKHAKRRCRKKTPNAY